MPNDTPACDASVTTGETLRQGAADDSTDITIRELKRRLAQSTVEIATLSEMLRQAEADVREKGELNAWLRQLALCLLKPRPHRHALRALFRHDRSERRPDTGKLFDDDAYLIRYADVAAAQFDPLLHYLHHGIDEDRKR